MGKNNRLDIRVNEEFMNKIDELCRVYQCNRTQLIERLVFTEWSRSTSAGMEELQNLVQNINSVTTQMKEYVKAHE